LDCSEFVNSDEFAKSLAPFHPETAYITASRYMLKKSQYLFARREDFCIETTLATRSLIKMVQSAQELGYFVTVVYLWLRSPEIAVQRVADRVEAGGHDVPPDVIRRRYYAGLNYFFNTYAPACDKWMLVDNSECQFQTIAEGTRRGMTVRDPELFHQILSNHDSP
jgi:predicted ABC-type ATPase